MSDKYYIIVINYGVNIYSRGPYKSKTVRDNIAKKIWKEMSSDKGDNLFRASVDDNGNLSVDCFVDDELKE